MKRHLPWMYAIIAFIGGGFAWWVDSRNDEPQAAALVILMLTFALGMVAPRKAWLWGLISGLCLPIGYLIAKISGYTSSNLPNPGWYAASLALISAFIGAYAGALARAMLRAAEMKS